MLSNGAFDLIGELDAATSAREVGHRLVTALAPLGARGIFAGSFPGHTSIGLHERVAQAQVLAQISPAGWQDNYAQRGLDEGNPVILAPGRTIRPFRWSEGGLSSLRGWKGLDLARELKIEDGLAIPCAELDGRAGIISLCFERLRFGQTEIRTIQFAAIVAYERMRTLSPARRMAARTTPLTDRERDCLGFVAAGKSDAAIAGILNISANTVHWHLKNAKRKLGVCSRAQAVAKLYETGLL